jgi:hypothetical protein
MSDSEAERESSGPEASVGYANGSLLRPRVMPIARSVRGSRELHTRQLGRQSSATSQPLVVVERNRTPAE